MSGPIPKAPGERRRRNSPTPDAVLGAAEVAIPPLRDGLHTLARDWYASLAASAQRVYFEPSDWAQAVLLAEVLDRFLTADSPRASMFSALWAAMDDLLTTEGARRRARIQVTRAQPEATPGVTAMADYRALLTKGGRRNGGGLNDAS